MRRKIKELSIFNIIDRDISDIENAAHRFKEHKTVLVFGIGGSSLGAKALVGFRSSFDGKPSKVRFIENVDSRSFLNVVSDCDPYNTGVIVISKSGRTTETLMLFLSFVEMWEDFDYANNAIAITEDGDSNKLRSLANSLRMQIIDHPKDIGGRFSVLSAVGLLPSLVAGVNVKGVLSGARKVVSEFQEDSKIYDEILKTCDIIKDARVNHHVMFSYSDFLCDFGKWFAQLISESLGKRDDFGITPLCATGTVDQHSMLQLFLGGPSDKYYTFVVQKKNLDTVRITSNVAEDLQCHNIHELMIAHQRATIDVLRKKSHVRVFEFEEIDEFAIGYMIMLMFIETCAIAEFFGVNPFDQPAVEESKMLAMEYLKKF